MKVSDLIRLLQACNQDYEVVFGYTDSSYWETGLNPVKRPRVDKWGDLYVINVGELTLAGLELNEEAKS